MRSNWDPFDLQGFLASKYGPIPGTNPPIPRSLIINSYAYPVLVPTMAANGRNAQTLTITANSDFVFMWMDCSPVANAVGVTMQVQNIGQGYRFYNDAVPVLSVVQGGFNLAPKGQAYPIFLEGNTALQFTFVSPSGGNTAFQISLSGVQVRARDGNMFANSLAAG